MAAVFAVTTLAVAVALDRPVAFIRGGGRIKDPEYKKMLSEQAIDRQMKAHFLVCCLLVLAPCCPSAFAYQAGIALMIANSWLLGNLLSAVRV